MTVPLNKLCKLIVDCPHSTAPDEGTGYPLIRTPNIGKGVFDLEGVHRVSEPTYNKRNTRAIPQDGDLILAREAPAGNVAIIQNGRKFCLGQRTVLVRPDSEKVNPLWLNYYLNAPEQQHALLKNANGATVSHVNMPIIRNLPINLPDDTKQCRIADILSAYDMLIENNRKQIKLLEEVAQRLYKEWFIDFKFPGHETIRIDPETGIPNGWEKKKLVDYIVNDVGGGWGEDSHSSDHSINASVIRATDIGPLLNGSCSSIPSRWHKKSNFNARELLEGDIIFEVSGGSKELGVGRSMLIESKYLEMIGEPAICASFCKRIRCESRLQSCLLFQQIQHDLQSGLIRKFEKRSAGNIINFLWVDFLEEYTVLIPNHTVFEKMTKSLCDINSRKATISLAIHNLQEARDRLLPKLMSAEIEV